MIQPPHNADRSVHNNPVTHTVRSVHNNAVTQQLCCYGSDGFGAQNAFQGQCAEGTLGVAVLSCALRNLHQFAFVGSFHPEGVDLVCLELYEFTHSPTHSLTHSLTD